MGLQTLPELQENTTSPFYSSSVSNNNDSGVQLPLLLLTTPTNYCLPEKLYVQKQCLSSPNSPSAYCKSDLQRQEKSKNSETISTRFTKPTTTTSKTSPF